MKPRNIFGERTWNDVSDVVTARLRRSFMWASRDDIEDAVALAMVDLVDYWIQLPSSIVEDDSGRTFWQACKRGTWMAKTFLTQEWDDRDLPVDALSGDAGDAAASVLAVSLPLGPSAEEVVLSRIRH